nr:MotA/TolQ/ExbB proton channel family protein [Rhodopirellula sp. SM50]
MNKVDASPVSNDRLVWMRRDIERRFGFAGARYTRVGSVLPALIAAAITVALFGSFVAIGSNPIVDMFIRRGWTPPVIVFFSVWSMLILWFKRAKLKLQQKALRLRVMPDQIDFVLSVDRVSEVLHRLYEVCDDPKRFVLLHRIEVGLSNARNLSRVVDLGEILRTQSEHDESVMETSFNLIRGLVWAIPILGFIGTVSGLSIAIGGFGRVLSQTEDPSKLIGALQGVTGGLATAFETTLLALMAALLVQMTMTFQKKQEEEFLDECTEYCQREVLSRIAHTDASDGTTETKPQPAASGSIQDDETGFAPVEVIQEGEADAVVIDGPIVLE